MATVTTPKQVYISNPNQETNFTSDYSLTSQSVIMYGNESTLTTTMEITLPHYSVVGNILSYKLYNRQPSDNGVNMIVKAPTLNNVQMIFKGTSPQIINSTTLVLAPNSTATVFIIKNNYSVMYNHYFTPTPTPTVTPTPKPILHWVNSVNNCNGISSNNMTIIDNYDNFTVGKSLEQWGCENYSDDMQVVQITVPVPYANSFENPPATVSENGIYIVEPYPQTTSPPISSSTTTSNTSSSTTTSNSEQQAQQQVQQQAQEIDKEIF